NLLSSKLATALVQAGVVVVWAAGNDGGDGTIDNVNAYAKNPIPGNLAVANYDDDAVRGGRNGALAPSSSRGASISPSTWPDLSAPGTTIRAAFGLTGPLGWAGKALDWAGGGDGNPFGNAINQHSGDVSFRVGGTMGPSQAIDWILYTRPIVIYNAHRNAFVTQPLVLVYGVNAAEASAMAFHTPASPLGGPVVGPDDHVRLTKASGTGNPITVQLTSPAGTTATVKVRFPCTSGCATDVPLAPHFAGEPSRGTWTLSPGPTVAPDFQSDGGNPWYVTKTGTSMAAPHVAGVVALVRQANPDLTPAQIEHLLETTAFKFASGAPYAADPTNPDSLSSFDKGHGLVDAKAAVLAALARLPDLVVDSVSFLPPSPVAGQDVEVTVRVRNAGPSAAGASRLDLRVDGTLAAGADVPALAGGAWTDVSFVWRSVTGGHAFVARADAVSQVRESNEANNERSAALAVG
ncbi:MAG TPA: S8 family serine peptidase, partial [Candidatus Thermoplasmatota archaeon]|nr:S8 family serine peptidase [Candidatus Thermoplasmatota archaeon]